MAKATLTAPPCRTSRSPSTQVFPLFREDRSGTAGVVCEHPLSAYEVDMTTLDLEIVDGFGVLPGDDAFDDRLAVVRA